MEEAVEEVAERLSYDAVNPPANDPCLAAFGRAASELIQENKLLRPFLSTALRYRAENNRNVEPRYVANMLPRVFQKRILFDRRIADYPFQFDSRRWKAEIQDDLSTQEGQADFFFIMQVRDIQSNISERYKALKILGPLYEDRFDNEPTILDIGCSQNQGLKKLHLPGRFMPVAGGLPLSQKEWMNSLIDGAWEPGESVGVDAWPIDREVSWWAKSCTFRPVELLIKGRVDEYDAIDAIPNEPPASFFGDVDFAQVPPDYPADTEPVGHDFDIAVLSTVLYQLSPDKRQSMLQNAYDHTQSEGLVVVIDFAYPMDNNPHELVYLDDDMYKKDFQYRTLVFDKTRPEMGFQEFLIWNNGRCNRAKLGELALRAFAVVA